MFISKIPQLIAKLFRDFVFPLKYEVNITKENAGKLDFYYFKFSKNILLKGGSQKFSFDENGIPLIPHYLKGTSKGKHYYPISIGQFALAEFHEYLITKSNEAYNNFLSMADWILENQSNDAFWYSHTDMSKFKLSSPWVSAMSQGRCMSVLIRAYGETGEEKYLNSCKRALMTFDPKITTSKLVSVLSDDEYFYQEYPGEVDSSVLNGAIFALWGIYDFYLITKDEYALDLFHKGVNGIIKKLSLYDLNYWSCYDLYHLSNRSTLANTCTAHYHNIHIKQMLVMHKLTGREEFLDMHIKWKVKENKFNLIRAYSSKLLTVVKRG